MTTLITGGSGFLGRGIMKYKDGEQYVVYSRDEYKQDMCRRKFHNAIYRLGDVKDFDLLKWTIKRFEVDTVIHTAAVKYIPEAEINALECISVNIDGSRNVAKACIDCGVSRVIGISTDKAAQPVNVYGATKMIMERIFGECALVSGTKFTLTRYGNVVGSTGSVIPLFLKQFTEDGRITLTDPDMTRFWISIRKAVQLIAWALNAESGHMIIPKASAMTMLDLALSICGSRENIDIVGARLGEKQHEAMITSAEAVRASDCIEYYDVGTEVIGEPFVLTSNNPHIWVNDEIMSGYIEMAQGI